MEESSTDRIEKQVELRASVSRVWRALTDPKQFGEWFGVDLEAPFIPGKSTRGSITNPGYEHVVMEVKVNHAVPLWITHLLARHGCTLRRFSKYCAGVVRLSNESDRRIPLGGSYGRAS